MSKISNSTHASLWTKISIVFAVLLALAGLLYTVTLSLSVCGIIDIEVFSALYKISECKYIIFFVILATLATYSKHFHKDNLHYITKPLATFIVLILASRSVYNSSFALFVVVALSLSLIGDVFMMFCDDNICFHGGLVSFLLAHFLYTAFFFTIDGRLSIASILLTIPLLLSGGFLLYLFRKSLKKEVVSIVAYLIIISIMLWRSYVIAYGNFNMLSVLLIIGTTLFYSSDSIIAYERFIVKLKYGQAFLLTFYFAAQLLITIYSLGVF